MLPCLFILFSTFSIVSAAPKPANLANCERNSDKTCDCKNTAALRPLLRSWNEKIGDHFYMMSHEEQLNAIGLGYTMENDMGLIGTVSPSGCAGIVPIYRMWSDLASDHLYTTNYDEKEYALKWHRYNLESTMGYCMAAPGCGLVPLHRFWNPQIRDHFYTSDEVEKDQVLQDDAWRYEGIQCYVWQSLDLTDC